MKLYGRIPLFHSLMNNPWAVETHASHSSFFFTLNSTAATRAFPYFLSSNQYCSPTFPSFHKHGYCTHVPIRQGPVTTGQSEPRAYKRCLRGLGLRSQVIQRVSAGFLIRVNPETIKDVEGPGSEITGQYGD